MLEEKKALPERFYTIFEMILLVVSLLGQMLIMLIPLMLGVERQDLSIAFSMATFGYSSSMFFFIGYMISTGFVDNKTLNSIVIGVLEHFITNYVPIVIIVTVVYSI